MKILTIILIGFLFLSIFAITFLCYKNSNKIEDDVKKDIENLEYQGPVPEGYDLEHFRKTGETILE